MLLAATVPEKRAAEYGENRITPGVHFPSGVEAGRILAISVIAVMARSQPFKTDFVGALDELRAALGVLAPKNR